MKSLIFINNEQFGYHTDTLKYVQYLKNKYRITYICQDYGKNIISEDNVKVIYISGSTILFPLKVLSKIYSFKLIKPIIFIKWHPLSFIR